MFLEYVLGDFSARDLLLTDKFLTFEYVDFVLKSQASQSHIRGAPTRNSDPLIFLTKAPPSRINISSDQKPSEGLEFLRQFCFLLKIVEYVPSVGSAYVSANWFLHKRRRPIIIHLGFRLYDNSEQVPIGTQKVATLRREDLDRLFQRLDGDYCLVDAIEPF